MPFDTDGLPSAILAGALLVVLLAAGMWDVYVGYRGHYTAQVSDIISGWARQFPILPLVVGMLIGHLFWSRNPPTAGPAAPRPAAVWRESQP